jgi:phage-related protein
MAAQPFDKETIDKVTEAFKKLNTESDKTLSQLEASAQAEQKMVDMAKQLGQVYKTQQDKIDDQLKGKNLQEKIQLRIKNSEEELNKISASRINSQTKINSLENELLESTNKLKQVQSKDPLSSSVKDLKDIIQKKEEEINLEKQLLTSSKDTLSTLQKELGSQKSLNNALIKTVELVALIGGTEFIKDLNAPKTLNDLLSRTYSLFKEIDKAATELRKTFGLFRSDAEIIESNIREIVIELGEFGVKADDVKKAMSAIGKNFNYIDVLDKSIVKDISIMSKQMGISEEKSSKFLKAIGGIKGQSGLANKSMLSMAGATAAAYGVGLDELMSDVADASEEARMYAGKNADEMVRAAAQARQMGTTLDSMARTAKGLLDFESSIQAELKASALIGKNINFNEARRLSFQGKVVEANKLILDQAKKIKFNQLNPIAQEAFAKAAGKSVKELQDMLESESRMKSALTSNNKEVREAAKAQLEKQNLLKSNSKLAQQEYEKNLLNKANQERIVILQNRLNAALQKIMLPVLEALTNAMEQLVNLTEGMNLETLIKDLYAANILIKNTISTGIVKALDRVKAVLQAPFKVIKALGDSISTLGGKIANFLTNKFAIIKNTINLVKGYFINFELIFKQKFLNMAEYLNKLLSEIKITEFGKSLSKLGDVGWIKNLITKLKDFVDYFKVLRLEGNGFFSSIIKAAKTLLTSGLDGIFDKIKKLRDVIGKFFGLGDIAKYLGPLKTVLPFLNKILTKIPILGNIISAIQVIYGTYTKFIDDFNNPNLSGWQKVGKFFKALAVSSYEALVEPFIDIGKWIGEKVFGSIYDVILDVVEKAYNIGASILDGIKSVSSSIINSIKNTFSSAWDSIKDWLGFSPSELGLSIVKGIDSIGDSLISAITSPFTKAFELVKLGLELIWEKMKGIGSFISDTIGKTFSFVGRIVGVSEETPSKTATESKTSVKTDDLLINTIVNSNRVLAEKLDKLTSMMASGQIAVYIDGQRANQLLATSNSKFGSFGQATTN